MALQQLTTFFAWSSVINFILLTISFLFITLFRGLVFKLHSKMFAVSEERLAIIYLQFLSFYKIIIIVFNLVPYIVLRFFL